MRLPCLCLTALFALPNCLLAAAPKPNIIFILANDLGYGALAGRDPAGALSDHIACFPDVMPTLLDVGGAIPKGIDGVSFAPTLRGDSAKQKAPAHLFWEFAGYGGQQAVRV